MKSRRIARAAVALSVLAVASTATVAEARTYKVGEYKLPDSRMDVLQQR